MKNWRTCKWCGQAYRKKEGLDKNGNGRKVWKMILGFPLYVVLGGFGKNEAEAMAFGGHAHGMRDNNIFFHSIYCSQNCYIAAKEQNDIAAAEKAKKKAEKEAAKAAAKTE